MKRISVCPECKRQWDVTSYGVGQKLRCVCGHLMEVERVTPRAPEVAHCHTCGAPRVPGKAACQYCGAIPTNLKMNLVCPFCLCRTADESKYCQSCGKTLQAMPLDALTGKLQCPRCGKTRLKNRKIGEYTIDECAVCAGMWVGAEVFQRIVNQQAREREEKEYSHQVKTFSPLAEQPGGKIAYIKCPSCRRHMNRLNFARASGVIIDECRPHGIWLDRDELEKIAAYVATGGLRRSKEIELRELEQQQKRLATAGAALPIAQPGYTASASDAGSLLRGAGSFLDALAHVLGRMGTPR